MADKKAAELPREPYEKELLATASAEPDST